MMGSMLVRLDLLNADRLLSTAHQERKSPSAKGNRA